MKDYYDVYIFLTKLKNDINKKVLTKAMYNTFVKRESLEYFKDYEIIIESILESEKIKLLWERYSKKYSYARNINLNQILLLVKDIIKELNLNN